MDNGTNGHRGATWESTHDALVFTHAALRSEGNDDVLHHLAARIEEALQDYDSIAHESLALRRLISTANAAVQRADVALDEAIATFARALLEHVKNDTNSELYKKLFPVPHIDVIELGLDAEVPEALLLVQQIETGEGTIPESLRAHKDSLRKVLQRANASLAARASAFGQWGQHHARVEAWLESASGLQRGIRRSLHSHAEAKGHSTRWSEAFFRQAF